MKHNTAKHAVFLSIDGMTDPLGQSQVLPYLKGLREAGYAISLVSCEKPDRMEKHGADIKAICADAGINWYPLPYRTRPPLLSSLQNIRGIRQKAEEIHRQQPLDLIHVRSYLPMFAGLTLKEKFNIPVLFDIRGFWPDERVDGGLWNLNKRFWKGIYRYFKKQELRFYDEADRVIALTHAAAAEVHSWPLRNNPVPIDVIPCCADLALFNYRNIDPMEREKLIVSLNLQATDYIITYLGSLGTFYAIEDMLAYFQELKKVQPGAKFLIITASDPQIVWDAALKMNVNQKDLRVTQAPREKVPVHLSIGRYSLVFYRENYSRKACSPTKLGELMGLGIPVVCSPNVGDTTGIVTEADAGVALSGLHEAAYREAVRQMEDRPKADKAAIRKGALRYFDLEEGIEKYRDVYSKLTGI